jgi:hypothetical protein
MEVWREQIRFIVTVMSILLQVTFLTDKFWIDIVERYSKSALPNSSLSTFHNHLSIPAGFS